ncbi:MAG: SDR family oxidoreductase [Steroidobacteraceae bacterium]|jgi:short-subunit dehydrogenase|nr:SDR family oxidoreductase [Steroidobacteraceae bacterium]
MNVARATYLITGGAGGIGRALAAEFLDAGASVLLAGRDSRTLAETRDGLAHHGDRVGTIAVDLTVPDDRRRLVAAAEGWRGGVDVLVNNAGVNHFGLFEDQPPEQIDLALAINLQAPLQLCRALLPHLRRRPAAHVVNVGSVFGAIGYPAYAVYSATKFALRGFTEALRRELADTTVRVHYLAPRATRTGMNGAAVEAMNAELGVAMDAPARVAARLRRLLERGEPSAVVGWPEGFYTRLNAVLPGAVDGALRKQLPVIRRHARPGTPCETAVGTTMSVSAGAPGRA